MKYTFIAVAISLLFIASCKDTINIPDAQVITVNTSTSRVDTVKLFVAPNDTLKLETETIILSTGTALINVRVTNISKITLDTAGFRLNMYIQKKAQSGVYDSLWLSFLHATTQLPSGGIFNILIQKSGAELWRFEPYIRIKK